MWCDADDRIYQDSPQTRLQHLKCEVYTLSSSLSQQRHMQLQYLKALQLS